ncbi:WD40 repeat domain-containing protein [Proteiniphilum sp.]|nr:WD40 repeat domain-containing protein [Proteiniphilum sp.]MEA4918693.1 WD40 repeat domain-containing protein [Proteiniphilum sp.]
MRKISFLVGLLSFLVLHTNAQQSKLFSNFSTDENIIYDICFTHNGGAIGIADGKSVKVYSMETIKLIRNFKNEHRKQILSIDISADSTLLVSGGKDSTIVIWDFKEGRLLKSMKAEGIVTSVSVSPDSRYLAYGGSDHKVSLFDITNEKLVAVFAEHSDDITSIAFSPGGDYIAASSGDNLITVYGNGALVSELSGHKDFVRDISFDSDGTKLISCGDDGNVIIWDISDIENPKVLEESKRGSDWLLSVDFHPDNETYAFAGFSGNIEIISQNVHYKTSMKVPVNKVLFTLDERHFLTIVAATRGKGVLLMSTNRMLQSKKDPKVN